MHLPLCFVLMPFGRKTDPAGQVIDFDEVYSKLIKPAVEQAHMQPIRADEERTGGIIHKPMYDRAARCCCSPTIPDHLRTTVMVQEQYALALNRNGQGDKAERVLRAVIEHKGPSSETYGILGRVYKDR
jgi:hypothetical protein